MASPKEKAWKFDVFVAHSKEDEIFKDSVVVHLEKNKITCCHYQEHFAPGKPNPLNIYERMNECRKILFIISQAYLRSDWIKFEKSQAEKISQSEGRKNIIYVLYGDVKEDEIPYSFKSPTYLKYDPDPVEKERFFLKLRKQIQADLPLKNLVPAGNIAHGFAWSYFFDYLNLILKGLKERVLKSEFAKIKNSEILARFVIILPEDGKCVKSLEKVGLKHEGHIPFKATRAGIIQRDYKHTVYSVEDGGKKYIFPAEFAAPLQSLYDMEISGVAGVTSDYKEHQTKIFIDLLREILEWSKWRNNFLLIKYKWSIDSKEEVRMQLANILLDQVKTQIQIDKQTSYDKKVPPKQGEYTDEEKYHAYIACYHNDKDVVKFAKTLQQDLTSRGYKCVSETDEEPGKSTVDTICGKIEMSRRVVLLISREGQGHEMDTSGSDWFNTGGYEAISKSVREKKKMIIPVLYGGIDPDKVPFYVSNVTYIEYPEDPNYLTKIINGIEDDATLTSMIPSGNVAKGLAWTYYLGFLQLILPALGPTVTAKYGDKGVVFDKMVIILPKDCYCPLSLSDADKSLTPEGKLEVPITKAGNIRRSFTSPVYSIMDQDTRNKYYFVAELPPPFLVLYEMSESTLAGLTSQQREIQREKFIKKLGKILEHSKYEDDFCMFRYDGSLKPGQTEEGTLSEQLLSFVKNKIHVSSGIFSLHRDFDRDL